MLESALSFTQSLIEKTVAPGDTVIDATVGNGHDTLFLAEHVGETGQVIGFDIQEAAIGITQAKIIDAGFSDRVTLYHKGHEEIDAVLSPKTEVSLVVYNLGYLPKGVKAIITRPETTIESINQSLDHLKRKGLILLMIYYGHEGGDKEKSAVMKLAESLPQKQYSVLQYQFINQQNSPPFLIAIEKR